MIIGITGTNCAGKGEVVETLKSKGFEHLSVRAFLTKEIIKRGLEVSRDNMRVIANSLRANNSPDYIVNQLYEQAIKNGKDVIIESIRCPGEVNSLSKKENFILIAVDANPRLRYERALTRNSVTDNKTFEEFVREEEAEMGQEDPWKQNISTCMQLAKYKIINEGTLENLKQKVDEILSKENKTSLSLSGINDDKRPSWDEYFMEICMAVASRSTCNRGKVGCVIAKNKQILVTGYAGSPKGLPHCNEVGHQIKTTVHEDGSQTQHCVRTTHAEQNAICQAAKLGVPIDEATLYCKMTPCSTCAKMIINSGIKRIVCEKKYQSGQEAEDMFSKAGIEIVFFSNEIESYNKK